MQSILRFLSFLLVLPCFYLATLAIADPEILVSVPDAVVDQLLYGLGTGITTVVALFAGCAFLIFALPSGE